VRRCTVFLKDTIRMKMSEDGVFAFLTSIIKKSAETIDMKSMSFALQSISTEVGHIAKAVMMLTDAISRHNDLINDLYKTQESIMKIVGISSDDDQLEKVQEHKINSQKLN